MVRATVHLGYPAVQAWPLFSWFGLAMIFGGANNMQLANEAEYLVEFFTLNYAPSDVIFDLVSVAICFKSGRDGRGSITPRPPANSLPVGGGYPQSAGSVTQLHLLTSKAWESGRNSRMQI